ncbi:MAG TPA: oligosaccharide flippase family protein [Planctomycetota bacterium]|nr:oligosaccharide flippase family protein [Planctomycetota bacterium]
MTDLGRRAVRGTMAVFAANTASRLVSFAGMLYLMERVGAEHFGVVAYAASLLAICDAASNWGFSQAAIHRSERADETFATFLVLRVLLLLAVLSVALGAASFSDVLLRGTPLDVMVALAIALVWDAVSDVQATRLARSLRFGRLMVADVVSVVAGTGAAVAMAASGAGLWALVANRAVYSTVRLVCLGALSVERLRLGFDLDDARWLLRFGLPLWLGSMATTWVLHYDDLVVGRLCGKATLGQYDRAYSLGLLPLAFVTGVLTRVSFPLYARLQGDRARLSEAFRIVSGTTLRLAGPMALGLALAIPDFLAVMRWEQWQPMTPMLRWLLVYAVLRPLMDDAGSLLTAIGRPKVTGHTLVAEALALLVLCPLFTSWWGAEGAAASVGLVVLGGLGAWYVAFLPRVVDFSRVRLLALPLVSLAAAGAAGVAVEAWSGLAPGLPCGSAKLAAIALVYAAGILLLDGRQTLADLKTLRRHAIGKPEAEA